MESTRENTRNESTASLATSKYGEATSIHAKSFFSDGKASGVRPPEKRRDI